MTSIVSVQDGKTGEPRQLSYSHGSKVGSGSFGVVYQIKLANNETAAIKRVLVDKQFMNRELELMRQVSHPNIVELKAFFHSNEEKDVYLNLVLEYMPESLYQALRHFTKARQHMPDIDVKLYTYQLFRSLEYIHSLGICHRDIKPQNLLVDSKKGVLKLCDFGSAKILIPGKPNVSYISSRFYRAPELIFGAQDYTTKIDIWSAGCVMAELMLGKLMFPGDSGVDQLVEIIKVLGTPSRDQIRSMNPNYIEHKFPQIKAQLFSRVFKRNSEDAIDLISKILEYSPSKRLTATEVLEHPYFDELRGGKIDREMPELFDTNGK